MPDTIAQLTDKRDIILRMLGGFILAIEELEAQVRAIDARIDQLRAFWKTVELQEMNGTREKPSGDAKRSAIKKEMKELMEKRRGYVVHIEGARVGRDEQRAALRAIDKQIAVAAGAPVPVKPEQGASVTRERIPLTTVPSGGGMIPKVSSQGLRSGMQWEKLAK